MDELEIIVEQVYPFPYAYNSPEFAYSLRCELCRLEVAHSKEQHLILQSGIQVQP